MRFAKMGFDGKIQFQTSQFSSKRGSVTINFSKREGVQLLLVGDCHPAEAQRVYDPCLGLIRYTTALA
jgi:hypothetical protein